MCIRDRYKVTKVGDKMKKHGGIKKGEKFHDSEIDGMHDSGIKVKYQKEALSPRMQKTVKVVSAIKNPQATATKVIAKPIVKGISKGIKKIQQNRAARSQMSNAERRANRSFKHNPGSGNFSSIILV